MPASSQSLLNSDPLEHERQLAKEVVLNEKLTVSGQGTDGSRANTISYEKALERELEYQKRMKMTLLQHPIGSAFLPIPSQLAATGGLGRSAAPLQQLQFRHPAMQQQQLQSSDCRPPLQHPAVQQQQQFDGRPPHQLPDQWPPLHHQQLLDRRAMIQHQFFYRRPPLQQQQQVLDRRPLVQQQQQVFDRWPPLQQQQQVLALRPQVQQQQQVLDRWAPVQQQQQLLLQPQQWKPPPHGFNIRPQQRQFPYPHWCNVCKVECTTSHNFKVHLCGEKHKVNCEQIFHIKLRSSLAGSAAP